MRFLFDQNMERRLADTLKDLGHDVKIVGVDHPAGILDEAVLSHAFNENRILLTNDRGDFGKLIFRDRHPHCGVILFRHIRSGDLTTKQNRLLFVLEQYKDQLDQFIVVTGQLVRVRKTVTRQPH
jgi:predicted nuclease of predicted toxin-antitoxin system